jgi:hypothetical protein
MTGGALARHAANSVGLKGHRLERVVRAGEWSAPTSRVLVLEGVPRTFELDAWIGLLDNGPDAALSHDTALALWNVPGFELRPIHITRGRGGTRPAIEGVDVHRSRLWPPHHRLVLNASLPIVSPTRALFDVANDGQAHDYAIERAINTAWARGLTSGELLAKMADEWCERGRRGAAFLRSYLESRPIDWKPPESNLERRFVHLITEAGMPAPVRQLNVGDYGSWIGRIDFKDPFLPLIAEVDSDLFHTAPLDTESDAERDARLTAAGFRVEHFKEHEIWYKRNVVLDRWRTARNELFATRRRN